MNTKTKIILAAASVVALVLIFKNKIFKSSEPASSLPSAPIIPIKDPIIASASLPVNNAAAAAPAVIPAVVLPNAPIVSKPILDKPVVATPIPPAFPEENDFMKRLKAEDAFYEKAYKSDGYGDARMPINFKDPWSVVYS